MLSWLTDFLSLEALIQLCESELTINSIAPVGQTTALYPDVLKKNLNMSLKPKQAVTEAQQGNDLAWLNDVLRYPSLSGAHPALLELACHCSGLVVLEHNKLPESAMAHLTPGETQRAASMSQRRRQGFLGVRLGIKLLARSLCPALDRIPAHELHTLDEEASLPALPQFSGSDDYQISASHNAELTVVAISTHVFGIDIEDRAAQAWRGRNFFMHPSEQELAQNSPLGPKNAALRVWSSKEAAAKAFNLGLVQAAQDVCLITIDDRTSIAEYQNERCDLYHFAVDKNLISVLTKQSS